MRQPLLRQQYTSFSEVKGKTRSVRLAGLNQPQYHNPALMTDPKIIGILLVKDEDSFIENIVLNILEFCDEVFIAENFSRDRTFAILSKLAEKHSKIRLKQVSHPKESHEFIEKFAGTNTWVFGVDGDEIYDPSGLRKMKTLLQADTFSEYWCIYGNVLNCVSIDLEKGLAKGYLAPPSRSMTKLYNFSMVESWTDCPQRLHWGTLQFKNNANDPPRLRLYQTVVWEQSYFRCLHAAFMQRSSLDVDRKRSSRLNPSEILKIRSAYADKSYVNYVLRQLRVKLGFDYKHKQYRRGPLVEKSTAPFFQPPTLQKTL